MRWSLLGLPAPCLIAGGHAWIDTATSPRSADLSSPDISTGITLPAESITFPVPVADPKVSDGAVLYVRVSGNFSQRDRALCVAVVQTPWDCSGGAFGGDGECLAKPLWNLSKPGDFLGFELPRPAFTLGVELLELDRNNATAHSVCLRRSAEDGGGGVAGEPAFQKPQTSVLGRLTYYKLPQVHFEPKLQTVRLRTFLNPGWAQEFRIECVNCSASNRVAVKPVVLPTCQTQEEEVHAALAALNGKPPNSMPGTPPRTRAARFAVWARSVAPSSRLVGLRLKSPLGPRPPCKPLDPEGPCLGYMDDSFDVAELRAVEDSEGTAEGQPAAEAGVFMLERPQRLAVQVRRQLLHTPSALCFYPDPSVPRGWLVGFVNFHQDEFDVRAFVAFVCFSGIILPIICMITVLLHMSKLQRVKSQLRLLRMDYQRDQLQQEIGDQRLGLPGLGSSSSSSSRNGPSSASRSSGRYTRAPGSPGGRR
eukprot:TRINITY_DN14285_c0_g1_i1.p1 TRINITY_DN14285_c0_g1~~TRINITY_DN14285_c0_g1_i1.p1  ORF type:complete len:479 (-),score=84.26 TRINITY_DN14285_c0_g1_i1:93-1529(-)